MRLWASFWSAFLLATSSIQILWRDSSVKSSPIGPRCHLSAFTPRLQRSAPQNPNWSYTSPGTVLCPFVSAIGSTIGIIIEDRALIQKRASISTSTRITAWSLKRFHPCFRAPSMAWGSVACVTAPVFTDRRELTHQASVPKARNPAQTTRRRIPYATLQKIWKTTALSHSSTLWGQWKLWAISLRGMRLSILTMNTLLSTRKRMIQCLRPL